MYNEYFGFSEAPFSIAPDPRYLFMSVRHREALAHLLYGLKVDGGFVLLTGEVGTGKTTICRCLLEQVPEHCDIAFIINPKLTASELLRTLCEELHITVPSGVRGLKALVDLVNVHLLQTNAGGRKTVLIVDEAQNLSNDVLEHLRLLTNLETNQRKLLQIILLGQPELRERLAEPGMRQLAQRIVARYHLDPLSRPELAAYVQHRLSVVGGRHTLFPAKVLDRLYRLSGGTPRLINVICDRALLGTWAEGKTVVRPATLDKAASEVLGPSPQTRQARPLARRALTTALLVAILAGITSLAISYQHLLPTRILETVALAPQEVVATDATALAPSAEDEASKALPEPPVATTFAQESETTLSWPSDTDHWLHEALAVRALFQLWRIDLQPVGIDAACAAVRESGMQCLRGTDEFETLRALNTPAILEMRQADGPNFFATLFNVDKDRAHLVVGAEFREVPFGSLRKQWTGAYTLLWRGPPGLNRVLGVGTRGEHVIWVERRLARWEGREPPSMGGDLFDAALAKRIRSFQGAHGLDDDGVVGPMTLLRLSIYSEDAVPILAVQSE